MNKTLEEIALEVGKETALWVSDGLLIEFARRLVARLGAQEPTRGKNYEAGLWSRRNYEAWLEDQATAPKPEDEK